MLTDRNFLIYFLSHVPEIGGVTIRKICDSFRTEAATDIDETVLSEIGFLNEKQRDGVKLALMWKERIREEYRILLESDIRYLTYYDPEYPERLRRITQPPMSLFVKGNLPDPAIPSAAIVGARAATHYGLSMAEYLAESLAAENTAVISGLALGIDGAAHRGALKEEKGSTFAVLAGGVNICYPKEHFDLYCKMISRSSCGVLSELLPGSVHQRRNFPMRNRIISGLADVIIVVEAREKSGSLITAEYALNQGKEVLVVPGRLTDPLSRGCNRLIADGARIITTPDDILETLGMVRSGTLRLPEKDPEKLTGEEKTIYETLDLAPKYSQDIVTATGIPYPRVCRILLELELKGYVYQMSGNYYGLR